MTFKNTKTNVSVKVFEKCVPNVIINPDALTKMHLYVDECADEIGWLGTAYKDEKKNIIYISDVFLFDQEVHSTTTEISPEGLNEFGEKLLLQPNGMDIWNNLKVWGHSHVNMSTSSSSQDDKQMETFVEGGHDWFIRIIANKSGELNLDLYSYDLGVIYNSLPWVEHGTEEEIVIEGKIAALYEELAELQKIRIEKFKDDIEKEMALKVKKKTYAKTNNWGYGHTTTVISNTESGDKKKTTSTKTTKIESIEDAYLWFEQDILLEIGECEDMNEVRNILWQNGAYGYLLEEVEFIWTAGKEVASEIYFGYSEYGKGGFE